MITDKEDFTLYLYYNFPDDYRAYTREGITRSAENAIQSRHESKYGVWKKLSTEPWIKAFYGDILPPEVFSGQLPVEFLRERAIKLVLQNPIYLDAEVLALRMQYPVSMPNMVYKVVPFKEMKRYENILTSAGYDEDNLRHALDCKKKEFIFTAKMESLGVPEEKAQKIIRKAETINYLEQLALLNQKVNQAKTAAEREHAQQQMDAFIIAHAEYLYNNREQLNQVMHLLEQTTPNNNQDNTNTPPETPNENQDTPPETPNNNQDNTNTPPETPNENQNTPPETPNNNQDNTNTPPETPNNNQDEQNKSVSHDDTSIFAPATNETEEKNTKSVKSYAQDIATVLDGELTQNIPSKSAYYSPAKGATGTQTKGMEFPHPKGQNKSTPSFASFDIDREDETTGYGLDGSSSSFGIYDYLNNRMDNHVAEGLQKIYEDNKHSRADTRTTPEELSNFSTKGMSAGMPKLKDYIAAPLDLEDWSSSYITQRAAADAAWREEMSKITTAVHESSVGSRSLEDFTADLTKKLRQMRSEHRPETTQKRNKENERQAMTNKPYSHALLSDEISDETMLSLSPKLQKMRSRINQRMHVLSQLHDDAIGTNPHNSDTSPRRNGRQQTDKTTYSPAPDKSR